MMPKNAKNTVEPSPVNTPGDNKPAQDTGKNTREKKREPKPAKKVVPMFRRNAAAGRRLSRYPGPNYRDR